MARTRTIALVAAAATVSVVGTAGAGDRFDSEVTIKFRETPNFFGFYGKVRSERGRCERNRRVIVFRREAGPDSPEAFDKTDADGKYADEAGFLAVEETYYARASRKQIGAGTCKRAFSEDFFLEGKP